MLLMHDKSQTLLIVTFEIVTPEQVIAEQEKLWKYKVHIRCEHSIWVWNSTRFVIA